MEKLFSFDNESVARLRSCTMRARSTDQKDPCLSRKRGWYKSETDPNDMLDCFPALRLKKVTSCVPTSFQTAGATVMVLFGLCRWQRLSLIIRTARGWKVIF